MSSGVCRFATPVSPKRPAEPRGRGGRVVSRREKRRACVRPQLPCTLPVFAFGVERLTLGILATHRALVPRRREPASQLELIFGSQQHRVFAPLFLVLDSPNAGGHPLIDARL